MPIDYSKLRNITARELSTLFSVMDSISDLKKGVTKDITTLMEGKSQFHFMVQAILFLQKH